jgi:hypothetical protein
MLFAPVLIGSRSNCIYGAFDSVTNKWCGLLWCGVDIIENSIYVRFFSLKKEYQGGGLQKAIDFLLDEFKDSKLKKRIVCSTARPKAFEEVGFTESKRKLLVYEVNDADDN